MFCVRFLIVLHYHHNLHGERAILTGYILELLYYCKYRAYLEYRRGYDYTVKHGKARNISSIMTSLKRNTKYRLVRKKYSGDVYGVFAIVKPDLTLIDSEDRPIAVIKTKLRNYLKTYISDYASLLLASYLLIKQSGISPMMIVVVAKDPGGLINALNYIVESGPIPARREEWIIASRVYDRNYAENFLFSSVKLLESTIPPTVSPKNSKCSKCPFRDECPFLNNTL